MTIDKVRFNKTVYSWDSSLFKIDNVPVKGVLEVDYEEARDVKMVYAGLQSGRPWGMTSGKYSVKSFTLKVLRLTGVQIVQTLATKAGAKRSYGDPFFGFIAQVSEPDSGLPPITAVSPFNRIIGKKDSYAEGIDELATEFTVASMWFVENGNTLWSQRRAIGE